MNVFTQGTYYKEMGVNPERLEAYPVSPEEKERIEMMTWEYISGNKDMLNKIIAWGIEVLDFIYKKEPLLLSRDCYEDFIGYGVVILLRSIKKYRVSKDFEGEYLPFADYFVKNLKNFLQDEISRLECEEASVSLEEASRVAEELDGITRCLEMIAEEQKHSAHSA